MSQLQRKEALFLDALSVPSPGEVFAAMNKAVRPNWATLVTPATAPVTTDRTQLALAVGVLAANGYIAVEAQDGQQVKNVGREIMSVAKALGVSQSLLGRGNSLIEFADNNAWDALADELEATENEVKTTMVEQKDRDLVTLTSAAAWLRGLEVASGVVLAKEDLQGESVLRQPALARQLSSQLGELPSRMTRGALVSAVRQTLESIASKLESLEEPIGKPVQKKSRSEGEKGNSEAVNREAFQRIHDEAAAIVKAVMASPGSPTSPTASGASNAPAGVVLPATEKPSKP